MTHRVRLLTTAVVFAALLSLPTSAADVPEWRSPSADEAAAIAQVSGGSPGQGSCTNGPVTSKTNASFQLTPGVPYTLVWRWRVNSSTYSASDAFQVGTNSDSGGHGGTDRYIIVTNDGRISGGNINAISGLKIDVVDMTNSSGTFPREMRMAVHIETVAGQQYAVIANLNIPESNWMYAPTQSGTTGKLGYLSCRNNGQDVIIYDGNATFAPDAPTNLTATPATSSSISLSWTAPAGGTPPTGYSIWYRTTSASGTSPMNSTWTYATHVDGTSGTVTGLSPQTTYYFRVAGTTTGNEGQPSGEASASTYPSAPLGLIATGVNLTDRPESINLIWNYTPEVSQYYRVYRNNTSSNVEPLPAYRIAEVTGADRTWVESNLTYNQTFYYCVTSYNASTPLESPCSAVASNHTGPIVQNVNRTLNDNLVNLTWDFANATYAPTTLERLDGYNVHRSTDPNFVPGPTNRIATLNTSTQNYTDALLTANAYYYCVAAFDVDDNEAECSARIGAEVAGLGVALTAQDMRHKVRLQWTISGFGTVTSYNIYRNNSTGFEFLGNVPARTTIYYDTAFTPDDYCIVYGYQVGAVTPNGEIFSNEALGMAFEYPPITQFGDNGTIYGGHAVACTQPPNPVAGDPAIPGHIVGGRETLGDDLSISTSAVDVMFGIIFVLLFAATAYEVIGTAAAAIGGAVVGVMFSIAASFIPVWLVLLLLATTGAVFMIVRSRNSSGGT